MISNFPDINIINILVLALAVLVAVTFHEFAHGAVANMLGDPTAKQQGRVSLNPIRHLDVMGTIMFVIVGFGWGKPVPINTNNFKHPRWGMAFASLAGPVTNFVIAATLGLFLKLGLFTGLIGSIVEFIAYINIILGVFNLFPLPPLDGSRLVSALLPESMLPAYHSIEGYGVIVIFLLIFIFPGGFSRVFGPFINFFTELLLV